MGDLMNVDGKQYMEGGPWHPVNTDFIYRRDMQWAYVCQCRVHDAPVDKMENALEIGCSTGLWALYFHKLYPSAHVVRVDKTLALEYLHLHPTQMQTIIPQDFLQTTEDLSNFDLVRAYRQGGYMGNWLDISRKAFDVLRPGGFFEICDASRLYNTLHSDWSNIPASFLPGCTIDSPGLLMVLKQAGFSDLRQHHRSVVLDPSTNEGRDLLASILEDLECVYKTQNVDPQYFRTVREQLEFQASQMPIKFTL